VRARWVKPEFFNDKKIGALGPTAAVVYEALWCSADDGGTAICNAEIVKGQLFMYWPTVTIFDIAGAIAKLASAGRIDCYSIGDVEYASIPTERWKRHQPVHNPSRFRHPGPPTEAGLRQDGGSTEAGATGPVTKAGEGVEAKELTPDTEAALRQSSGSPHHLDSYIPTVPNTSTPKVVGDRAREPGPFANLLITRLNQGMHDNPAIGEGYNPVPHGHGQSLEAAEKILTAGVPTEFASDLVYAGAKKYKPTPRNRQINSVSYLADGVISDWEKEKARRTADGTSRPAGNSLTKQTAAPRPGYPPRRNAGEENFANAQRALEDIPQ
jgi:hypothetical protein